MPLRDAIARAGGLRIRDGFISPLDLVALGLHSQHEAEEIHTRAMHMSAPLPGFGRPGLIAADRSAPNFE